MSRITGDAQRKLGRSGELPPLVALSGGLETVKAGLLLLAALLDVAYCHGFHVLPGLVPGRRRLPPLEHRSSRLSCPDTLEQSSTMQINYLFTDVGLREVWLHLVDSLGEILGSKGLIGHRRLPINVYDGAQKFKVRAATICELLDHPVDLRTVLLEEFGSQSLYCLASLRRNDLIPVIVLHRIENGLGSEPSQGLCR